MSGARCGFTLLQLMLAVALVGIVLGLVTAVRREAQTGRVYGAAFSPDGAALAVGHTDGRITIVDPGSGWVRRARRAHPGAVHALAFSADGRLLASGSSDGTVKLWDAATLREIRAFDTKGAHAQSVALSKDGKRLATGNLHGTVDVWDVTGGKLQLSFKQNGPVFWLRFLPEGNALATSDANAVYLWSLRDGSLLDTYSPQSKRVFGAAISPDGTTLAVGDRDGKVVLWNTFTGDRLSVLEQKGCSWTWVFAFSPDDHRLATWESDSIYLWDVPARRIERTLKTYGTPTYSLFGFQFSSDGSRLHALDARWGAIRTWDLKTGQMESIDLHVTRPASWLVLVGAWYLWTLAWIVVRPDSSAAAERLRECITEENLRARIAWYNRPWGLVCAAWGGAAINLVMITRLTTLLPRLAVLDPAMRSPLLGIAVGLITTFAFAWHFVLLARKLRAISIEAVQLKSRSVMRLGVLRQLVPAIVLAIGMLAAAPIVAWTLRVSWLFAAGVTPLVVALMYWEQAKVVRAAEARMAERAMVGT